MTIIKEDIILKKLSYQVQVMLSNELLLDQIDIDCFLEKFTGDLVVRLRVDLLGEKVKEVNVEYPKDWRQAVKERFAPKWLLRKWPVEYKKETLTAKAVYPLLTMPKERHFIHLFKNTEEKCQN